MPTRLRHKNKSLNQTQNLVYIPTFSIWTRGVVSKYLQLQLSINYKRIEESVSYERRIGWIEEATSFKRTFRNLHFFKLLFFKWLWIAEYQLRRYLQCLEIKCNYIDDYRMCWVTSLNIFSSPFPWFSSNCYFEMAMESRISVEEILVKLRSEMQLLKVYRSL